MLNQESANQLPMTIPVQVPGLFTMMMRVGHTPLPGQDCITIPGTALVLQVERIMAQGWAYVNGPSEASTVLDSGVTEYIRPRVAGPLREAPISTIHGLSIRKRYSCKRNGHRESSQECDVLSWKLKETSVGCWNNLEERSCLHRTRRIM